MLSFFSKKWEQAQKWIKTAAFQAPQRGINRKENLKQPICRILCVDDDHSFCQFMERLASSLKVQLDVAYSIKEAKQAIEEYLDYRAFIIDGHLPDGSGFEIVAWVREKKELETPIGFISRIYHDSKSFRLLKESLKVNYVLEKPIHPAEAYQLLIQLCHLTSSPLCQDPFSDVLPADLKISYEKTISDKVERLEKMILAVQKDPIIDHLEALKGEVHKIAGSAGSYGYMAVSEICKNLEIELMKQINLSKRGILNHQWLFSLDEIFTQIKLHFQIELVESNHFPTPLVCHLASLYIVDENQDFLNTLMDCPLKFYFDVLTEQHPEKAIQTLSSADIFPQIIFVNTHYQTSILTGYDIIQAFYQNNEHLMTTIVLLVEENELQDQLEALQRGMIFIFSKPITFSFFLPLLDQIPFRPLLLSYKILVIDDDLDICEYVNKTLKYMSLEIKAVQDLQNLEYILNSYQPDLILFDIHLTDEFGVKSFERIRNVLGYKKLLVGMLSITEQENDLIQKCYEAEINEILFKPLERGILQRKITTLLRKQTEETLAFKQDAVTGLMNIHSFKRYLKELQSQSSFAFPKTLVIFELENFASLGQKNKREVLVIISEALEYLLKKYDIAAYLGEGRFSLIFQSYDSNYIQLFMSTFLFHLYDQLKAFMKEEEIFINETLMTLTSEEKIEDTLKRGVEQLANAKQKSLDQVVRLWVEQPSSTLTRELFIFHDEVESCESIKKLFESYGFKCTQFSKIEEVIPPLLPPLSLLILMGSWASNKGIQLLKNLTLHHQKQIPILSFSQWPDQDHLRHFFDKINYFESPFSMVILMTKRGEKL